MANAEKVDWRDYLLELEEVLREAPTARKAVDLSCRLLGTYLNAASVGYIELEPDGVVGFVVSEWLSGALPSMQGRHLVEAYGAARLAQMSRGEPVVVNDVENDPLMSTTLVRDAVRSLGVGSFIEAPLLSTKQLRGWFYVSNVNARSWTLDEQRLVGETVRRTWHAAERARAEERLREREARLQAVLDQMPVGVILANIPDGQLMLYNKASATIMGHDMLGQVLADYGTYGGVHEDGRPYSPEEYPTARAVAKGERVMGEALRYRRPDGEIRHLSVSAAPIETPFGDFAICSFQDETALHAALERARLLNNELNHRIKNLLATIQAIARQTVRSLEERTAFESRLTALAAAHDILTSNRSGGELGELVEAALRPFVGDGRILFEGPGVSLSTSQTVPFALALHELATNAVKYGALSRPTGRVQIKWWCDDASQLRFEWREAGGPPVIEPTRRGFGSRMLERSLAGELRGSVSLRFEADGVVCSIEAKLEPPAPFL